MRIYALILFVALSAFNAEAQKKSKKTPLKPVEEINLTSFGGNWYAISRLPNPVDSDLSNVTVYYEPKGDKKIKETLKGVNKKGKDVKIKSRLTYKGGGKIKGPLGGKYVVLALDDKYQYFMMATPNQKYLWIMSRAKTLDNTTYNNLVSKASGLGFDTTKLMPVEQK